ncbi:hypothetical protein CDAR_204871 [Caerostris darwini]|uniref:Uncharacterized protein n=1 Tax=Caerostris darwini TaxID=1538125 RepID=A0AAV4PHW3_9ARAC|nr:hypothetical protein CDAR_204871 [Caerostris darwini]
MNLSISASIKFLISDDTCLWNIHGQSFGLEPSPSKFIYPPLKQLVNKQQLPPPIAYSNNISYLIVCLQTIPVVKRRVVAVLCAFLLTMHKAEH